MVHNRHRKVQRLSGRIQRQNNVAIGARNALAADGCDALLYGLKQLHNRRFDVFRFHRAKLNRKS